MGKKMRRGEIFAFLNRGAGRRGGWCGGSLKQVM